VRSAAFESLFAVQEEGEEDVLIIGLPLLETVLADGGGETAHGDVGLHSGQDALDGEEV
jgi:hypothetical protein